jgi:HEPN domain-containing protein
MLPIGELELLSQARLADAEALLAAGRFDGATYLCGYAVEIALKARICRTLNWEGFPETGSEFANFKSFRTHDLDVLLRLSGLEATIKENHFPLWNAVVIWDPESRYRAIGSVTQSAAEEMVKAAKPLLELL